MWTNLGKQRMFEEFFESSSVGSSFRLQLASGTIPTGNLQWGSNVSSTSQVVLVPSLTAGTSGLEIPRSGHATGGFNVSSGVELSASAARAVLETAANSYQYSGTITGARYVLLTKGAAAFAPTNAEVYAWWDIGSETNVATGNTLTITNLSLQGN